MGVTDYGAKALTMGEPERADLLADLYAGTRNIAKYTAGLCYDAVAFCWALAGCLDPDRLLGHGGQNLLGDLDFHAMIAVGGTTVRGTNSYVSTPDWSESFDLNDLEQQDGHYVLDGQPIEVWYR